MKIYYRQYRKYGINHSQRAGLLLTDQPTDLATNRPMDGRMHPL